MFRLLTAVVSLTTQLSLQAATPNIIIMFADDLGYADIGRFGAKGWKTPHIDSLAKDGVTFTNFYVAQPVCSASRAALLTGCYPNRIGIHGALGPNAKHGISDNELTLAELCQSKGYATGMVGKWHLGSHTQFLPTNHGFDSYYGLPYSNDMWPYHPEARKGTYPPLPMYENATIDNKAVSPQDQEQLIPEYTKRAVKFIETNRKKPFFLYYAHSFPHVPIFASDRFKNSSEQGRYGDVIQEIDWSMGELLATLKKHKLKDNTLVIFTSDNGPWLSYGNHAGSAGELREGKGTVWEGGVREPFVARWPGHIPAGSIQNESAMTIDILPTVAKLLDAKLPEHTIDGLDILPLLTCEKGAKSPHEAFTFYYKTNELQAIRSGQWKLILPHTYRTMNGQKPGHDGIPGNYKNVPVGLELYNLNDDVGETTNVADQHPDVMKKMLDLATKARKDMGDSLKKAQGVNNRKPGMLNQ